MKITFKNWYDYEDKKILEGEDATIFNCNSDWEVAYLIKKIMNAYPQSNEKKIRKIVKACCKEFFGHTDRSLMIKCILKKMREM